MSHKGFWESGAETNPSMQTYSPSSSIEMQLQLLFSTSTFFAAILRFSLWAACQGLFLLLCLLLPSFVLPID